jgi:hypothetical protein
MAMSSTERTQKWRSHNRERSNRIDRESQARRKARGANPDVADYLAAIDADPQHTYIPEAE